MTPQFLDTKLVINELKSELPDAFYVCGGVHSTAVPIETLKALNVDCVVMGEGEYTIKELCETELSESKLKGVRGIAYRYNGKIRMNESRELIENLDELPFPARRLLDFDRYLVYDLIRGTYRGKHTTIIASRGCPYRCIYCSSHLIFGRKVRRRSADSVLDEVEYLIENYGIKGVWFVDDTFTIGKNWVLNFCKRIRERKLRFEWGCQARVNTVSEEMLKAMKKAGCIQLDFGVESGSNKVLKVLKKDIDTDTIKGAFKLARRCGLRTLATFMVGNPEETKEDIEKTYKLAKEISADYTEFFFTTPYPGTELFKMATENNWIDKSLDFSKVWSIRQVNWEDKKIEQPIMKINFSKEELVQIRNRLRRSFLLRNNLSKINAWYLLHVFKEAPRYLLFKVKETIGS